MKDHTGRVYGRLTAITPACRDKHGNWHWNCLCVCGVSVVVTGYSLTNGDTKSCGCLNSELASTRRTTHGMSNTSIYRIWRTMLDRCRLPTSCGYAAYGAVGISVCERWLKFENFYADMGDRPKGKSLDRKDNNGNYEPDNCRWATLKEQARNTKKNIFFEYNGKQQCLSAWCEGLGLHYEKTLWRLKAGWTTEKAFTCP